MQFSNKQTVKNKGPHPSKNAKTSDKHTCFEYQIEGAPRAKENGHEDSKYVQRHGDEELAVIVQLSSNHHGENELHEASQYFEDIVPRLE